MTQTIKGDVFYNVEINEKFSDINTSPNYFLHEEAGSSNYHWNWLRYVEFYPSCMASDVKL
jgi:hypothetical protein